MKPLLSFASEQIQFLRPLVSRRDALLQRDSVSLKNLLEGLSAVGLAELQESFYAWNGLRRSDKRWLVEVLNK
jgi:hypothetical protein